ncbi:PilZ domain-containing protein [Microvirga sp. M2]|uniref:PilZ domain-containing protein n=1 Tax=Microvirga sp. M2 TaxID=3073270 RepID=UPI0039C00A9D
MGTRSRIDNRRQARRFRTQHLAKIVLGPDSMISCRIVDISTGGARIALDQNTELPDDFEIFIAAHDLQVHRARLCWRHSDSLGVHFVRSTDRAGALLQHMVHAPGSFQDEFDRVRVEVERDPARPAKVLHGVA